MSFILWFWKLHKWISEWFFGQKTINTSVSTVNSFDYAFYSIWCWWIISILHAEDRNHVLISVVLFYRLGIYAHPLEYMNDGDTNSIWVSTQIGEVFLTVDLGDSFQVCVIFSHFLLKSNSNQGQRYYGVCLLFPMGCLWIVNSLVIKSQ